MNVCKLLYSLAGPESGPARVINYVRLAKITSVLQSYIHGDESLHFNALKLNYCVVGFPGKNETRQTTSLPSYLYSYCLLRERLGG